MSYWVKPGLVELQAIYERMADDEVVPTRLRYAPHDDPTLEAIWEMYGFEPVPLSYAYGLFDEGQIDQLVRETEAAYLTAIISGDLGRAAQQLAQHGYTAPTTSRPGGMPMQQPAE